MRVILSRKGFDSGYGRVPSPILPDGRMVSLPIPDRDAPTAYAAIRRDGLCLGDLVEDLTRSTVPRTHLAHLDPDLDPQAVARPPGWRPVFGQQGASLSHLLHAGVGPGDLFLFFGWFRPVEQHGGLWRYVRCTPAVHAIWGWLLVGTFHGVRQLPSAVAAWAAGHPHLHGEHPAENGLFVAADTWQLEGHALPGAGLFTSHPARVLTTPGRSPSFWRLPAWMHPAAGIATLTYHGDRERWSTDADGACQLRTVGKGQEFVLSVNREQELLAWLQGLVVHPPGTHTLQP